MGGAQLWAAGLGWLAASSRQAREVNELLCRCPCQVLYTDVERREDQAMSTVDYSRVVGPSTEFLRSLVNLDLALRLLDGDLLVGAFSVHRSGEGHAVGTC